MWGLCLWEGQVLEPLLPVWPCMALLTAFHTTTLSLSLGQRLGPVIPGFPYCPLDAQHLQLGLGSC